MSETVRAFAHGDERRERGDWRRELLSTAYIYHTWRPPRLQQHSSSATPFLELPPLFSSPRAPCSLRLLLPLADCNLIRLERQRPLSRVSRVVLFLAHFYFCHEEQTQQQLYLCLLNRMLRTTKAHSNEATQSSNGYCCRRRQ